MFITGSITGAMGFAGRPLIFGRNPRPHRRIPAKYQYEQRYYTMCVRFPTFIYIYLYNTYERYDIFVEYAYIITTHTHIHTYVVYTYIGTHAIVR